MSTHAASDVDGEHMAYHIHPPHYCLDNKRYLHSLHNYPMHYLSYFISSTQLFLARNSEILHTSGIHYQLHTRNTKKSIRARKEDPWLPIAASSIVIRRHIRCIRRGEFDVMSIDFEGKRGVFDLYL